MGLYSTPSPPPPPTDYSQQKMDFAASQLQQREAQAKAYNDAVSQFNNTLSGYGSQIADWTSKVDGLNLTNDELFNSYIGGLSQLQNQLYGLNFNMAKPVFDSTLYAYDGPVQVGTPALLDLNTSMKDTYVNALSSLSQKISGLQQQRYSAEQAFNQSAGNMYSQMAQLGSSLGTANIGDANALNNYKTQLDSILASKNAFTSPILGDYNPWSWQQIDPTYQTALARYNDLMTQRQSELTRASDYEKSILAKAGNFSDTFGGLDIANEGGIKSLQDLIDAFQRDAGGYQTKLSASDYDFSQELGQVQSVEDKLAQLRAERQAELSRVRNAEQNYQNLALQLASGARTSNMFDSGRIQDLQAQIDALQGDIGGFSSKLATNFGLANNQLSSAEQILTQLLAQRGTTLDQMRSRLDLATGGIGNINAWDESGMNAALTKLMGLQNQYTPFMGSDVDPYKMQLQSSMQDINNMLMALSGKRSDFETQAQQLLDQINGGSYTSLDMLDPLFQQTNDLQSEARKYAASQSYDEFAQILQKLNAEKSRLQTDAANVATQTQLEQQNPLGGTTSLADLMDKITPEQYAQLMSLSQKAQEGDQNALDQYNAFLLSIGVGA